MEGAVTFMRRKSFSANGLLLSASTVSYILVALTFTFPFFTSHTATSSTVTIFGMPLATLLMIAAPVLLAAMEIASVKAARQFWASPAGHTSLYAALVFVCLQALPVTATYLTTREQAFEKHIVTLQAERKADEERQDHRQVAQKTAFDARSADIADLKGHRDVLARELDVDNLALKDLEARGIRPRSRNAQRAAQLERSIEMRTRALIATDEKLTALADRTEFVSQPAPQDNSLTILVPTFSEYLGNTWLTFDAVLSLFIALLFPVFVAAMTLVTLNVPSAAIHPTFDLRAALQVGGDRDRAAQNAFARLLKPAIVAHLVARKAARELGTATAVLSLKDDDTLRLYEEVAAHRRQIVDSDLADSAKRILLDALTTIEEETLNREAA